MTSFSGVRHTLIIGSTYDTSHRKCRREFSHMKIIVRPTVWLSIPCEWLYANTVCLNLFVKILVFCVKSLSSNLEKLHFDKIISATSLADIIFFYTGIYTFYITN